ncbi:MAG: glutathione S-transferase family protein [Pseudomonadota bacterium]|nr:glutathione S-transferase family protein [Pseudomonadota bacterium]
MGMLIEGNWSEKDEVSGKDGKFVRPESKFRNWITPDGSPGPSGDGGFKAEVGRYHLYVSHNCPWAYRTLVFRRLKGLEDKVSISIAASSEKKEGWTYTDEPGCIPDVVNGAIYLHEIYSLADPKYTGRVTVPTLWDKKNRTIVTNESSEIIRMFNSAFKKVGSTGRDYYPENLQGKIDEINELIYSNVNNGVYRCGFASTQMAYEQAFDKLFDTLDELEEILESQRYLLGSVITEADWRLFSTLLRFDIVYYGLFKCNKKRLRDYSNLWNYTLELYQQPGIAEITDLDHIKRGYYANMPRLDVKGFVPKGPEINLSEAHTRGHLKQDQ